MADPNLGTLQTIAYENLVQFINDVNRNFAVIQNSPLFKGIPGADSEPGDIGPPGIRGSKFVFIDFIKFQSVFTNEIATSAQIDLVFLNSKLSTNDNKNLLLTALDIPFLVDGDVIVLTNSVLLNYNFSENKFYDTKKSLSQSVTNDIENIIRQMFLAYLPILQSGISNVFESYQTLAKNYSDNNNVGITNAITGTSVFSPFIQGITPNTGIPVPNHKYYGLSNSINTNENSNNTMVFGNIVKYYKLLMNTIATDGSQTLTSDYAPGVGNIPAAIFMQDTYRGGLMFGYKDKQNLKSFGSIYKNEENEVVIKSDSGKLGVDFSSIKLHKNYLRYNKLVQFSDSLEVSQNMFIGGHINSGFLRTGKFTNNNTQLFVDQDFSDGYISIGPNILRNSILELRGEQINIPGHKSKVLVTNNDGNLVPYIIENYVIPIDNGPIIGNLEYVPPIEITTGEATKRVITTYYYNYLVRKINSLFNEQINGKYWTKGEFNTNVIPNLKLNDSLNVAKTLKVGSIFSADTVRDYVNINSNILNIDSNLITADRYYEKVLVFDEDGQGRKDVELSSHQLPHPALLPATTNIPNITNIDRTIKLLNETQLQRIIDFLNVIRQNAATTSWTKAQFINFDIPSLAVNTGLFSRKYVAVNGTLTANSLASQFKTSTDTIFLADTDTNDVKIGNGATKFAINSGTIIYGGYNNVSLTTNANGQVLTTGFIGDFGQGNITQTYATNLINQVTRTVPDNKTIGALILSIVNNYNNIKNYVDTQINVLSDSLTQQLNQLANSINQQITIINGNINDINTVLGTKATIAYVDSITNTISTNLSNLTTIVNQNTADIALLKQQMLTKVSQTDFNSLVAEFNDFKNKIPKIPKGLICLWEGKTIAGTLQAAIPEDWEEVTSMRGRVAVGWTNGQFDYTFHNKFSVLNEFGGNAKHILSITEIPPHNHTFNYGSYTRSSGGSNTPVAVNGNAGTSTTNNTGGNGSNAEPHENTQPYRVLIYIRSQKGF